MSENNGTPAENAEFDESTIPQEVRARIEKEAREGFIPKERYDSSVGKLKDRLTTLEQKAAQEPPKQEPVYTRAQLRALVDEGKITEDAMDAQLEKQMIAKARAEAQSVVAQGNAQADVGKTIDQYTQAIPDLNSEDSEARDKAEQAYEALEKRFGAPTNDQERQKLTAAALEVAFGPVDKLQARVKELSNKERQHHQEQGGGEKAGDKSDDGSLKGLDAKARGYYQKQIDTGMYKDWSEVNEMLKKAPAKTKARLGI